jgi:hypothetical protein
MTAAAAAHNAFELGAGAGLVFQRELGLPAAITTWSIVLPGIAALAKHNPARGEALLSWTAGASLAAVATHFTLWPWRFRLGVPYLTQAEGLSRRALPAYNTVLLIWAGTSLLAAVRDIPPGSRRWFLPGLMAVFPFRAHAERHFTWICHQAQVNPSWWNRAIKPGAHDRKYE